jgi:hypothetical protein
MCVKCTLSLPLSRLAATSDVIARFSVAHERPSLLVFSAFICHENRLKLCAGRNTYAGVDLLGDGGRSSTPAGSQTTVEIIHNPLAVPYEGDQPSADEFVYVAATYFASG